MASAIFALVEARARALALKLGDPIIHHTAMRTDWAIWPKHGLEVLARLVVIVKNRIAEIEFFACHVGAFKL